MSDYQCSHLKTGNRHFPTQDSKCQFAECYKGTMLQFYHFVTSFGTMTFFITVLWTLYMDIKLMSGRVRQRTELTSLPNVVSLRELEPELNSSIAKQPAACENSLGDQLRVDFNRTSHLQEHSSTSKLNAQKSNPGAINAAGFTEAQTEKKSPSYWNAFKKSLEMEQVINPHVFEDTLHPGNICSGSDVFLLVYVHSAPENHKRRMIIRNTWGNPYNIPLLKLKVHFQRSFNFPLNLIFSKTL